MLQNYYGYIKHVQVLTSPQFIFLESVVISENHGRRQEGPKDRSHPSWKLEKKLYYLK